MEGTIVGIYPLLNPIAEKKKQWFFIFFILFFSNILLIKFFNDKQETNAFKKKYRYRKVT